MTAWERVEIARDSKRPTSLDYIGKIFDTFMELHGDRAFRDDGAMIGGLALLDGQPVTVIGVQKGRNTKDNITRNFGMPSPEGYRKALRLMKQAKNLIVRLSILLILPEHFVELKQKNADREKRLPET